MADSIEFSIAPLSPYSVWASKLQKLGQGPWSTPDKKKAMSTVAMSAVASDVFANSPEKKTKGKDGKPKDVGPKVIAESKGGESSTKAKVAGRGKTTGGGKTTGRGKTKTSDGETKENNDEGEDASTTVDERFAIYSCL